MLSQSSNMPSSTAGPNVLGAWFHMWLGSTKEMCCARWKIAFVEDTVVVTFGCLGEAQA